VHAKNVPELEDVVKLKTFVYKVSVYGEMFLVMYSMKDAVELVEKLGLPKSAVRISPLEVFELKRE